ncbi:sodium- and chloride-dependent taurine transporter-like [Amphiura filiformis]|uniref:sodium- and chloride-dependent taurine transporter-like n=1 Tax=Amphiura filiformis TaxID=82378 RepID=UPI003B215600
MSVENRGGLKERDHWVGRLDFMFSLIGFSVGLGNVWRFPYLCYKNGGGAFLIPYFICLVVGGIPVLLLELGLGQFMSQGGITCWNILPGWRGIGIASIIVIWWLNCYYNVILAWDVYYIGLSFAKQLPWSHCNNDYNTDMCLEPEWVYGNTNATNLQLCGTNQSDMEGLKQVCLNGTLKNLRIGIASIIVIWWLNCYYNVILAWDVYYIGLSFAKQLPWSHCNNDYNTDMCLEPEWVYGNTNATNLQLCGTNQSDMEGLKQVCLNGTLKNLSDFTPAVDEFWERKLLKVHLSSGIDDMGSIHWQLTISLFIAWIIVFFIICKGVKTSGKIVCFTAVFPYVIMTCILIRAVTLENAVDGIRFYLRPDISRILDDQVWLDAATQIFYSYSIGIGTMMCLSSYNKKNHNFLRDGLLFACINSGTSVYSGFVIFAVLGFMAGQQNVGVGEVAKGGPGLAFIAYPEAVAQMPLPQLWAVLFFIMILLLGIDSQVLTILAFDTNAIFQCLFSLIT